MNSAHDSLIFELSGYKYIELEGLEKSLSHFSAYWGTLATTDITLQQHQLAAMDGW